MEIPLFPLSSVLFPKGRMPLQIFEQRYIDLVRSCMKTDSGFGVVFIKQGSEVSMPGRRNPRLGNIGTYARIIDWDSLSNGLLGITVEGCESFRINSTRRQDDNLLLAEVEFTAAAGPIAADDIHQHLIDVLNALLEHPHARGMTVEFDLEDTGEIGNILAQLLPVSDQLKYELLCIESPLQRLERLDEILGDLSGDL
ncbi:MAG: Lon protease-like protein [Halieaceae bacterium]|jgi:Lon protease-like protein